MPVAEAHALLELAAAPLGQSELGRRLDLAKSTVSRLVSQLEQRDWVERSPDGGDRRASRLTLTDAGRSAAAELAPPPRRFAALLDAVPPDRRHDVLAALDVLTAAARRSEPRHA